jgi:uncharacterized protein YjbI with pentapeptide repeats
VLTVIGRREVRDLQEMMRHLRGPPQAEVDLGGANIPRANLSGANLLLANLEGARLDGADLRRADLRRADLTDADLRRADLGGANLSEANLKGADLGGARLDGANLSRADLSESDLGVFQKLFAARKVRPAQLREPVASRRRCRRVFQRTSGWRTARDWETTRQAR